MKKVLFVCSGNRDRSPTAEEMFRGRSDLEVRSAGTSLLSVLRTRLSRDLVNWADVIFVMEDRHADHIAHRLGMPDALEKVIVLRVPDRYRKNDLELRRLLRERVAPHLDIH
ncbi:MAG: protein tyrosine phosphatase [Aigarchaeota archaeon]|nr:protein tyrosine phosphatase [Aigarchaeota archaeon]MDH5704279.1 protein tyrosine phosphatase [Aigarchaeota archaeon]